jgi:hypothetical protein
MLTATVASMRKGGAGVRNRTPKARVDSAEEQRQRTRRAYPPNKARAAAPYTCSSRAQLSRTDLVSVR